MIAPRQGGRRRTEVTAHSGRTLRPTDVTTHNGIPCTTVARTLLDLADVLRPEQLERAVERAEMLRLLDLSQIDEQLANARGRHGAARLSRLIAEARPETITRSELEERFLGLCGEAGIPRPLVNAHVEVDGELVEVDFLWPDQRLIVETDGHAAHATRRAFERDRRRDRRLTLAGYRVVRFTWRDVVDRSAEVADEVGALLGR